MKNVKLMRNENDASDKWIYISEDGVNPTTKLLYDDGEKPVIRAVDKENGMDDIYAEDKFASSIDWVTTNI